MDVASGDLPYDNIAVLPGVVLRQLHVSEAGRLFQVVDRNRQVLEPWLPWVKTTLSAANSLDFINQTLQKRQQAISYEYGIFAHKELIGHMSLMHIQEAKPEIGYWIDAGYTGRGITTAAVLALTRLGRQTLQLPVIIIRAHPDNEPSNRVAQKCAYHLADIVDDPEYGLLNIWQIGHN